MARFAQIVGLILLATGCYTGSARSVSPLEVVRDPGWLLVPKVSFIAQTAENDCGAAALAMMLAHWGRPVSRDQISAAHRPSARGLRAGELRAFAKSQGLQAFIVEGRLTDLETELARGRPVIVGLGKPHGRRLLTHYEVVVGLHRVRQLVLTLDPARGWSKNTLAGFAAEWAPARNLLLVMFPASPTAEISRSTGPSAGW
jgi:ABC-type bacteriocin/lantibiotic exporter with double-glycine peptidase domain